MQMGSGAWIQTRRCDANQWRLQVALSEKGYIGPGVFAAHLASHAVQVDQAHAQLVLAPSPVQMHVARAGPCAADHAGVPASCLETCAGLAVLRTLQHGQAQLSSRHTACSHASPP